jgi:hypothetical protein
MLHSKQWGSGTKFVSDLSAVLTVIMTSTSYADLLESFDINSS